MTCHLEEPVESFTRSQFNYRAQCTCMWRKSVLDLVGGTGGRVHDGCVRLRRHVRMLLLCREDNSMGLDATPRLGCKLGTFGLVDMILIFSVVVVLQLLVLFFLLLL